MKRIRVTAAVIRRDDKILLAQRSATQTRALLWEFPGGKVEAGESDADCLRREIREELGVDITVGEPVGVFPFAYDDICIDLAVYRAELVVGTPDAREHARLAWVPPEDLLSYPLAEADLPAARLIYHGKQQEL